MISKVGGAAFLQLWKGIAQITQDRTFPDYLCTLARDEGEVCEEDDDLGGKGGERYHFDQGAGMCRKFAYEGCAGNRNRYEAE